jgi:hypothetical protein
MASGNARAVNEEISQSEKRRWQVQRRPVAREQPCQKRRIFEVIDCIIGHFDNATKDLGSRNASSGQTRLFDDFIGAAFCPLCLSGMARQRFFARG